MGAIRIEPAATLVQGHRQIPMIERRHRSDALLQQGVDQARVEVQPQTIDRPPSLGQHPAPGQAEAIEVQPQLSHERHVFAIAMIVITGQVAGVVSGDPSRCVRETMPDTGPGPVGERESLDLIGRGRHTPEEVVREAGDHAQSSDRPDAVF